jgi:hypothetical protein
MQENFLHTTQIANRSHRTMAGIHARYSPAEETEPNTSFPVDSFLVAPLQNMPRKKDFVRFNRKSTAQRLVV